VTPVAAASLRSSSVERSAAEEAVAGLICDARRTKRPTAGNAKAWLRAHAVLPGLWVCKNRRIKAAEQSLRQLNRVWCPESAISTNLERGNSLATSRASALGTDVSRSPLSTSAGIDGKVDPAITAERADQRSRAVGGQQQRRRVVPALSAAAAAGSSERTTKGPPVLCMMRQASNPSVTRRRWARTRRSPRHSANGFSCRSTADGWPTTPSPRPTSRSSSAVTGAPATTTTATPASTARCAQRPSSAFAILREPASGGHRRPSAHRQRTIGADRQPAISRAGLASPAQLSVQPGLGLPARPELIRIASYR
jgi:hypothetical protein